MPVQGPPWTEFLSCHVCFSMFDDKLHRPISLGCGHTVCKTCLSKLQNSKCPFDQNTISSNVDDLPVNYALLQLVGAAIPEVKSDQVLINSTENKKYYESSKKCIEDLAVYLKSFSSDGVDPLSEGSLEEEAASMGSGKAGNMGNLPSNSILSRPMQRKLVSLVNCQLVEEEGRSRAMRAARSLGERSVTELILQHQNSHQLSTNLWAAVRARGCQFLGPGMQEEVLRLILLVLDDASSLSRKVLVLFVVQQLEDSFPQASKTAIGHVVQLLYRASCFKVTKRDGESSLMQLKEEFRSYEALRREHDSQIVQIAMEAGLRISPEQWSSLLYGDAAHKSHMQSIIDKLQTPQSFSQSVNELAIALQRTGDPCQLQRLRPHLEFLANIDPSPDVPPPTWENLEAVLKALRTVVQGLVEFFQNYSQKKSDLLPLQNARYKTSMCRDQNLQGMCPRGNNCTFAHSQEELDRFRTRSKKLGSKGTGMMPTFAALSPKEKAELDQVNKVHSEKLATYSKHGSNIQPKSAELDGDVGFQAKRLAMDSKSLNQSMAAINLSKTQTSAGVQRPTVPNGPNSVLLRGNTTPSVATPAFYRQPTMGVKETYYHRCLPQGMMKMSPYEMPSGEGTMYNPSPYHMNRQVANMAPKMHPLMSYPSQDPGIRGPPQHSPYMMSEGPGPLPSMMSEQWSPNHACHTECPYNRPESAYSHGVTPPPCSFDHPMYCQTASVPPYMASPSGHYQNQGVQSLDDLHDRRNIIIAQLHQSSNLLPRGISSNPNRLKQKMQVSQKQSKAPDLAEDGTISTDLAKSVADTYVAARTTFSLANSGYQPESQSYTYVPWSSDESYDMAEMDVQKSWKPEEDEERKATEEESETLYNLFQDYAEEAVKRESLREHAGEQSVRMRSTDETFIPFDPPLVSRFGPISRTCRAKFKSTDPVQVTADETMRLTTPVTAVTPLSCPYPVSALIPSRFRVGDVPPQIPSKPDHQPVLTDKDPYSMWSENDQFLLPTHSPTVRHHLSREVARLETQAHGARSKDESLVFELKAIELKISMQTGKKPEPSREEVVSRIDNDTETSFGKYGNKIPSTDSSLTTAKQRRLQQLIVLHGDGSARPKRGCDQDRLMSTLLQLQGHLPPHHPHYHSDFS